MNGTMKIRDPHFARFVDEAAESIDKSMSRLELPVIEVSGPTIAEVLGRIVPRPLLRAALQASDG